MFKSPARYGDSLNSYDSLKLIALACMVVDHAGEYIWPHADCLRSVGRIAFPLFLYLVGYSGKWAVKSDLILCAAAVALTAAATRHALFPLNVLATIAVARLAMAKLERFPLGDAQLGGIFLICLVWCPLTMAVVDYGTLALLFALCGDLQRRRPGSETARLFLVATVALHYLVMCVLFRFHGAPLVLMVLVGALTLFVLWRFRLEDYDPSALTLPLRRALQWASRNTLPLYALHVMAFMIIERWYFPERLAHFRWI